MCKNPADIQDPGYCLPLVSNEIQKKLPYGKTWETITCAELNSTAGAAALQHLQGYAHCCGGNAKLRCLNENKTCCDETGTIIPNGTTPGNGSGSAPEIGTLCKDAQSFNSSSSECVSRNAAMLSRIGNDHWSAVYDGTGKCGTVGRNKDSLYEHTAFGTMCCGERDKVCCLTCRTAPGTPSLLIIPSVSSRAGSLPRQLDNVQGRRGL
jgi:hypothetical protein